MMSSEPSALSENLAGNARGSAVPARCANLRANLGWYQLFSNLVAGGSRVFTPPRGTVHPISGMAVSSYLEQCEAEPTEEFEERLRNSFFLPYPAEIVTTYTSTLFRQEVFREPLTQIFGTELMADIDLRGHSVREFLRRAFTMAQVYGWVAVLTDYPRLSSPWPSAFHEARAGSRPYSSIILPTRLWDWSRDPITGDFLYAEVWNGLAGEAGRWRRWTPSAWADVDKSGAVVDGGEHTIGRVPIDLLICQGGEQENALDPFGVSALSGVANIALHCYQMCSLLEAHERRALFAFLHIKEDPRQYQETKPAATDLTLGSSHWLWSPGDVGWVEPPRSVPEEARAQISWAVQEMRRATGVATRSEESLEAHSGVALSWEYSSRHNAVYERAQNLEDFESRLWCTYGEILGRDVPLDAIRYPREYAVQPVEQELAELKSLTEIAEKWPGALEALTPLVKTKLRRVAIRDIGHLPEIDAVLDAIASMESVEEPEQDTSPSAPEPEVEEAQGQAVMDNAVPPDTALNGAQVAALVDIVVQVASGAIPRASALEIIVAAFPVDRAAADRILGQVGQGFQPAPVRSAPVQPFPEPQEDQS